ncbi:MAG: CoA transferase [Acidobacteria bacterium]|nr:CoA transferase [Candidatus Sulfomarinibacter kjeldsenii]
MSNGGALQGYKVIDFGQMVSAPFCAKLFSDFGADVIKVESPDGDAARQTGPFPNDEPHLEKSGLFFINNTNKRGVDRPLQRLERLRPKRLSSLGRELSLLRPTRGSTPRARHLCGGLFWWRNRGLLGTCRRLWSRGGRQRPADRCVLCRSHRGGFRRRAEHRGVRSGRQVRQAHRYRDAVGRSGHDHSLPGRPCVDAGLGTGSVEWPEGSDGEPGVGRPRDLPGHVHAGPERGRHLSLHRRMGHAALQDGDHGKVPSRWLPDYGRVHHRRGSGASASEGPRLLRGCRAPRAGCGQDPGRSVQAAGKSGRSHRARASSRATQHRGVRRLAGPRRRRDQGSSGPGHHLEGRLRRIPWQTNGL